MKEYVKCIGYSGSPSIPAGTCAARKKEPKKYERCAVCPGGEPIPAPAEIGQNTVSRSLNIETESFRKETVKMHSPDVLNRREFSQNAVLEIDPAGKKCNACGQVLPIADFDPHHLSADGYRRICKNCTGKKPQAEKQTLNPAPKPEVITSRKPDQDIICKDDILKRLLAEPGKIIDGRMLLDLRGRQDLQSALEDAAYRDYRTLNGQVLYCMNHSLVSHHVLACLAQPISGDK